MKTFKQLLFEMFEESNGRGSGKRLVGFLGMFVAFFGIIYLIITEGCSDCVEGLLQTLIITSCALLGLSSITGIFKNNNVNINDTKNEK